MSGPALLPPSLARIAGVVLDVCLPPCQGPGFDFSRPLGEPALLAPESLHWRVFKNPVSLYVGGVAAVILELAEPGVCAGVADHSRFRTDPLGRLRRTGHAAMVSIYGPRGAAEALIGQVRRMHAHVQGVTSSGRRYSACDPELLAWVQATTAYGFSAAYGRFVEPMGPAAIDRFYVEAEPASRLYGVQGAPQSQAELEALFSVMADRLEPSRVLCEFLRVMTCAPIMPLGLRRLQPLFVRAAIDLLPAWARRQLKLEDRGLRPGEARLVRALGTVADRIPLSASPAVQACIRVGLPRDWLHVRGARNGSRGGGVLESPSAVQM